VPRPVVVVAAELWLSPSPEEAASSPRRGEATGEKAEPHLRVLPGPPWPMASTTSAAEPRGDGSRAPEALRLATPLPDAPPATACARQRSVIHASGSSTGPARARGRRKEQRGRIWLAVWWIWPDLEESVGRCRPHSAAAPEEEEPPSRSSTTTTTRQLWEQGRGRVSLTACFAALGVAPPQSLLLELCL
jgi:hypothetical protein